MSNAETRLTHATIDDKLELNGFSGNNIRVCAYCNGGISKDNGLPIYYTPEQKKVIDLLTQTHGLCKLDYCIEIHKLKVYNESKQYLIGVGLDGQL